MTLSKQSASKGHWNNLLVNLSKASIPLTSRGCKGIIVVFKLLNFLLICFTYSSWALLLSRQNSQSLNSKTLFTANCLTFIPYLFKLFINLSVSKIAISSGIVTAINSHLFWSLSNPSIFFTVFFISTKKSSPSSGLYFPEKLSTIYLYFHLILAKTLIHSSNNPGMVKSLKA